MRETNIPTPANSNHRPRKGHPLQVRMKKCNKQLSCGSQGKSNKDPLCRTWEEAEQKTFSGPWREESNELFSGQMS
jgi:hypothetical protein